MSLLEVDSLGIRYGDSHVVTDLSFDIDSGESVGLVGESGSGKTQTALAILGLLPRDAQLSGEVRFDGSAMPYADETAMNQLRAERIGIVFQDPTQALNPYVRIGRQIVHVLKQHGLKSGHAADVCVLEMLARVGLPDPERQFRAFPHQLSGGMRQRAMIASALIAEPDVLIADEPTTALDVTVQAQILDLLERIRAKTSLLLITHDLAVVAGRCERVLVLQDGRLVEQGQTHDIFAKPEHEHTTELLAATPNLASTPAPVSMGNDFGLDVHGSDKQGSDERDADKPGPDKQGRDEQRLDVQAASVSFRERRVRRRLQAVHDFDLTLRAAETVSIVGESGSGKTSLVRAILGLIPLASGRVVYCGETLPANVKDRSVELRRDLQLVFQDPAGSLNPQMRIASILSEPLSLHEASLSAAERLDRVSVTLDRVGLDESFLQRFPHELSGGQAQRVAIARALILRPSVLICDEAVAALDGSTRRQVLALLAEEQADTGLSMLFISHDLAVVRSISHRVLVMYLGRLVEEATCEALFTRPRHPYTRALIDAIPVPDPRSPGGRTTLEGEIPSILEPPAGCVFHPRCKYADVRCTTEVPAIRDLGVRDAGKSTVACHRADELDLVS